MAGEGTIGSVRVAARRDGAAVFANVPGLGVQWPLYPGSLRAGRRSGDERSSAPAAPRGVEAAAVALGRPRALGDGWARHTALGGRLLARPDALVGLLVQQRCLARRPAAWGR